MPSSSTGGRWRPWHNEVVGGVGRQPFSATEELSREHAAWLARSEALWREAHAIVKDRPELDPGDVYHALRTLELPPAERLRRGLTRVRARAHAR